jgi:hypothetical protein
MAALEQLAPRTVVVVANSPVESKVEALRGYVVRSVQDGGEHDPLLVAAMEEAQQGWLPVVRVEAAEELCVSGDAPPSLAYSRGAREGGWLWWEAEEDLPK